MTTTLTVMTPEECHRCCIPLPEAGFGALETESGRLPLQAMSVEAAVTGLHVSLVLRQTFANVFRTPLEATYIFPLPDRAAVTRFVLKVAGRIVEGELQERGAARQTYDDAVKAGHRAAIAEEDRPGVFTMRVGNLPPGERAEVELELTGPLPFADGEATFRFPLVVAPRYIPGHPLPGPSAGDGTALDTGAVPDASRITPPVLLPGFPSPVRLSLGVTVDAAGLPLLGMASSLHALLEDCPTDGPAGARRLRVQPGERLDRDFILRLRFDVTSMQGSLCAQRVVGGAPGVFALTVLPPALATPAAARDVMFLLDRSGSMQGWKMVAARRAVGRMVDSLTPSDRFGVLAFGNRFVHPGGAEGLALKPASDRERFRAVEFLASIEAVGGTEMAEPLEAAASALAQRCENRERLLVLVTDGQVGNEDQLLRQVRDRARGIRIFTVGIDQAVNAAFLRRLSEPSGGVCELVESEDRLDEIMQRLHRRIGRPVVTGLRLQAPGLGVLEEELTPAGALDLFEGVPATLFGRYTGELPSQVEVAGSRPDGTEYRQRLETRSVSGAALASAWARARIRELEDLYASGRGAESELAPRIVALSLQNRVLSRFTAFVAVDRSEVVNRGGTGHRIVQPVEMPKGWDMAGPRVARAQMMAAGGPVCASAPAPSRSMSAATDAFSQYAAKADAQCAAEASPRGMIQMASEVLGGFAGAVLKSKGRQAGGRGGAAARCRVAPESPLTRSPLPGLLRALADCVERLEQLHEEADFRAELGYLMGDLDLLLAELSREPALAAAAHAIRELLQRLRERSTQARDRVLELVDGARTLLSQLLAGELPPDAGPPAKRKDFWK